MPARMPRPALRFVIPALLSLALAGLHAAGPERASPPPSDPIEGIWTGTISAPQGTSAELGLEFFRAKNGTLIFRLNFPEMFTYGVTFGIPVETPERNEYRITPAFDLQLHLQVNRLNGTLGAGRLPVELHRGGVFRPQPPSPLHHLPPAPRWRHDLRAPTWAPPVVADDVVYVGTEKGELHAVNARNGQPVWTWSGPHRLDGAVLVNADRIYLLDGSLDLVCLERTRGTLLWRTPLHDARIAGHAVPDNPTFNHRSATPLLIDGVLYAGSSDGGLYAVKATDGAVLWRQEAKAPIFGPVTAEGPDQLIFGTMDGSVILFDRHTCKEIRRLRTGGGVVTAPLVAGGKLIVGSRDYEIHAFHLPDGAEAWRFSYWFSWIESSPVLRDGVMYVGASDYRRITALDPANGHPRWSTQVYGMNWGTPLVTERRVFTGTVNQNIPGTAIEHTAGLIALDRATGEVVWQLVLPKAGTGGFAGFAGSLALAGDLVIAAGFDGGLYAYPAD